MLPTPHPPFSVCRVLCSHKLGRMQDKCLQPEMWAMPNVKWRSMFAGFPERALWFSGITGKYQNPLLISFVAHRGLFFSLTVQLAEVIYFKKLLLINDYLKISFRQCSVGQIKPNQQNATTPLPHRSMNMLTWQNLCGWHCTLPICPVTVRKISYSVLLKIWQFLSMLLWCSLVYNRAR